MKNLSKVLVKLIYGIIFPVVIIGASIYSEVDLFVVVFLTITCLLQSVLWFGVMQNVNILPSVSIETYNGFCFGFRFMNEVNGLIIIFPFVIIDLDWK